MSQTLANKEKALQELKAVLKPVPGIEGWSYSGLIVVPYMTPESIAETTNLTLDSSDVWIVSYPRSGTTWTQNIVKLLRNNGEKDGAELQFSIPFAESNSDANIFPGKIDLASLSKPRAFKSHLTYHLMLCGKPNTTPCKYIYIARNPKDVIVSYYNFYARLLFRPDFTLDWDSFIHNWKYGNLYYGNSVDHVLNWWPHRNEENVLFLTYEGMKKDPRAAVSRIAQFIGADVSESVIDKVVAETSFDLMKKDGTANFSFSDKIAKPGTGDFMRKGEVGDWRNYLTPEQSAEIDQLCQEKLKGTGLVFDFGK